RGRLVCRGEGVPEAALAYSPRREQVRTLADAFRRVGLAAGPCAGTACVDRAAQVIGEQLGWSQSQRRDACREYLIGAWRGRAPGVRRWGGGQEGVAHRARRGRAGGRR